MSITLDASRSDELVVGVWKRAEQSLAPIGNARTGKVLAAFFRVGELHGPVDLIERLGWRRQATPQALVGTETLFGVASEGVAADAWTAVRGLSG